MTAVRISIISCHGSTRAWGKVPSTYYITMAVWSPAPHLGGGGLGHRIVSLTSPDPDNTRYSTSKRKYCSTAFEANYSRYCNNTVVLSLVKPIRCQLIGYIMSRHYHVNIYLWLPKELWKTAMKKISFVLVCECWTVLTLLLAMTPNRLTVTKCCMYNNLVLTAR